MHLGIRKLKAELDFDIGTKHIILDSQKPCIPGKFFFKNS